MKNLYIIALSIIAISCQTKNTESSSADTSVEQIEPSTTSRHIPEITAVFDAHGGYDNWTSMKSLSYQMGESTTLVELQNRYTRIESPNQTVGFDGENVWVFPANEDADRQRMRYNLMFYFFAFPFVVGDPGINYEVLEPIVLDSISCNAVKVSYEAGVGDAPNDEYIVLSNPETNQMEWLMYTATFGGAPEDDFSLIKYENWQDINGIQLPGKLQWYQYEEGKVGEPRGNGVLFENITLKKEYPSMDNFKMPERAVVAEMPED